MRRGRRAFLAVGLAIVTGLGAGACASSGGGGGGRSQSVITFQELNGLDVVDCLSAIQRLRPAWLRTRTGSRPAVFRDGTQQMGGIDMLRTLSINDVEEIRFLTAADATTRYGTGYLNGAILVTTRIRSPQPSPIP